MSERRPKTTHPHYSLDSKQKQHPIRQERQQVPPTLPQKLKKWQQIAKEFNREIQLCTFAVRGASAHQHRSFDRSGGKLFELRRPSTQTASTFHCDPSSFDMSRNNLIKKPKIKTLQQYRNTQKSRPATLKRSSRPYIEIKSNIQYDRMVLKIGSNMQHEQKFIKYYIENIKKVQVIEPSPMPIVYGIKSETESYNACMTSFRNEDMPVCVSLFTESFNAKYQESLKIKRKYIEKMIKSMNGTYDPQIMSRMPIIHRKKQFNPNQYFTQVSKFQTTICHKHRRILQSTVGKIIRDNFPKSIQQNQHNLLHKLRKEAIASYMEALAMANLDYFLKDPQNLAVLQLRQYLPAQKENITSYRICYHGGYSKHMYAEWNAYVKHGRTQLPKKVYKLNSKVQLINSWLQNFQNLRFTQIQLFGSLLQSITIDQLAKIEKIKIEHSFGIFEKVCIRGVIVLLVYGDIGMNIGDGDFRELTECPRKYQYLVPVLCGMESVHSIDTNKDNELTNWYERFLKNRYNLKLFNRALQPSELNITNDNNSVQYDALSKKKINKSIEILLNIFYQRLLSSSLQKFIKLFNDRNPNRASIKLHLIVDRQSLKLEESEDTIIETFSIIINSLIKNQMKCTSEGLRAQKRRTPTPDSVGGSSSKLFLTEDNLQSATLPWQFNVQYKGLQIQEQKIKQFLHKIREWYHEAQISIQHFASFMPFIKLTAKQKIFVQDAGNLEGKNQWDQAKQCFLSNQEKVTLFRRKLAETPKKFTVGIFEIDCRQPHKILRERISQLQYIFQQKYISRIFTKIHQMQQQLAKIMTLLHSFNIRLNKVQDISQMFQKSKQNLYDMKNKTNQLAGHIYFCLDKANKPTTLITRFAQLVHKRSQLLVQIEELKVKIKDESCYLEEKRQQQRRIFHTRLQAHTQKLQQFTLQYFQLPKLDLAIETLQQLSSQLSLTYTEFMQIKDPSVSVQYCHEQQLYTATKQKIDTVYNYWHNVKAFYAMVRDFGWEKVRDIELGRYEKSVKMALEAIDKFQELGIEVNEINWGFMGRFKEDVRRHCDYMEYMKILANRDIPLQYYSMFDCECLLNMPLRDLLTLPKWPVYKPLLKQLQTKAAAQQDIYKKYHTLQLRFSSLKLTIIDLNGCDTLDPQLTAQMAETLRESAFECERLLESRYAEKYRAKIESLWGKMRACEGIVGKWLTVERGYLQLDAYYKNNDDGYFKDNFKRISQNHRKIIKSFDMDNSVLLLPSNSFLVTSLDSSLQTQQSLKKDLFDKFNDLQSSTCRLQLLTHEQLLEMMSYVHTIPKHLPKCLPSVENVGLCEQSLERVGGFVARDGAKGEMGVFGNYIELREPIHLGSRLANIEHWLQRLLNDIKNVLKSAFTHPDRKQNCLQILQLKQQLEYTQEIQEILICPEEQYKKLEQYLLTLEKRMEEKVRLSVQKYNTQMLLLLLIMQRDIISSLMENCEISGVLGKESFEWIKYARFYNCTYAYNRIVGTSTPQGRRTASSISNQNNNSSNFNPSPSNSNRLDIRMQVVSQQFQYNFMFIQKCQMIVQDVLFVGNCIVGKKGTGKKSIIKHFAYMSGNQLFVFQQGRISENFIENMVTFYKLAITTGAWLMIPQVNNMSSEEMRTIAECQNFLNNAKNSHAQKMQIFVYNQFAVNPNCRVFFTLQNYNSIPTRLAHNFRPIWLCAPSLEFISAICNEVASMMNNKLSRKYISEQTVNNTFKIIDFIYWNRNNEEVPLYLAQSMLEQFDRPNMPCHSYVPNSFLNLLINNKFILLEDLGSQFVGQDSNADWTLEYCSFSIFYLPKKQYINFITNNFSQETYVTLTLKNPDYVQLRQCFDYIHSCLSKNQIKYLFLIQGLPIYKTIFREMEDPLMKDSGIKVIYLQNVVNLQREAGIRIQSHYPTVILAAPKPKSMCNDKANNGNPIASNNNGGIGQKFKKIGFKTVSISQEQNIDLQTNYKKFINSLITNHLKNKIPFDEIEQILRWFNKMYTKLVNLKYSKQVSFVFVIAWVFGNVLSQKDIISELNKFQNLPNAHKYVKYSTNLRVLFPKKHQFVNNASSLSEQHVHEIKFNEGPLKFKSLAISSIKLLRQVLKQDTIIIKSEYCVQQILNILFPTSFHLYPIDLPSPLACKNTLEHILKIRTQQKTPNIIIHNIQRLPQSVSHFIHSFAQKNEVLYTENQQLKTFKERKCQFTFSTGMGMEACGSWSHAFCLKILGEDVMAMEIDQLDGVRLASKSGLALEENIYKGIISYYQANFSKNYWFQQPIRAAFKRHLNSGEQDNNFFMWLLRYQLLALPSEKNKIMNEICYYSAPISFLKTEQAEYQIKMSNAVQTNNFLEEALSKNQIQIRKNICKDLIVMNESFNAIPYSYDMLYKAFLSISYSHTILIGSVFTQRYYCLETAAKILNIEIVSFSASLLEEQPRDRDKESGNKKKIIFITDKEIREGLLDVIESLVMQEDSVINRNYVVVMKLDTEDEATGVLYKKYPFLKKYFAHVHFLKNSKQDITKSINLVKTLKYLQNSQNKYQLSVLNDWQIPPELQVEKSISHYFETQLNKNIGFLMGLLELRREFEEQEFNKYKFYRTLTEQLFHGISMLGEECKSIPEKLETIKSKQAYLNTARAQIEQASKNLMQQIESIKSQLAQTQTQICHLNQSIEKTHKKILNDQTHLQQTLKALCQKLDNLSIQQHQKFKQSPDNQVINFVYSLISALIKWEPGKLKKLPAGKLELLVKDKNVKWDRYRDAMRKIVTGWRNFRKKGDKIATIFVILIEWVQLIDYFYFKNIQEYEKAHVTIQKLQQQLPHLQQKSQTLHEKLLQKQQQHQVYTQLLQSSQANLQNLAQLKSSTLLRQQRIHIVLKTIAEKEQKIKISKDLAERLYFLPKIIMSKSIDQMALNEYEDDPFISRQLFLKSSRQQQQSKQVTDHDLFQYNLPLFQNIFDDFDSVLEVCRKYNLQDMDYDQVKIIHAVIGSRRRVQIVEDTHGLVTGRLGDICGNWLGWRVLDFCGVRMGDIKEQLASKAKTSSKILIQMSRYDKAPEIKKLIQLLVHLISEHENLKLILLFKKFEPIYQTDRFRWVSDRRVCLTYRKYLRQYAKIVYEKELVNEWEYYESQSYYNKAHKGLFEVFEKFQPENDESFGNFMDMVGKFDEARLKRQESFKKFDVYYEQLTTISLQFGPYYLLLKFLQSMDRLNPIQLFQQGNLLKNYQQVLKKVTAELYGQSQSTKSQQSLHKFLAHISNTINFIDAEQVNHYCMFACFLLLKPENVSPYFVVRLIRTAGMYEKNGERVRYIVKEVCGRDPGLKEVEQGLAAKNLGEFCQPWVEYLIFATSSNHQSFSESFLTKVKENSKLNQLVTMIKQRSFFLQSHYYISKSKLDFKNQFKVSSTACKQRACKFFWVIKVKRQHVQKFMQVLQNRVNSLRQQIKLVTFFFNEARYEDNFKKLLQLSQKKMFLCIFNLNKDKNYIIEQIISYLEQRSKNIHQMFKIFFLTEDTILIKNRESIDYISFIPLEQSSPESIQKNLQDQITAVTNNLPSTLSIPNNLHILRSLHIIIEKCTNKMLIYKQKDKIFKFLLSQLLSPVILHNEDNLIKFISEYFRFCKISPQEISQYCKLKQTLLFFADTKKDKIANPSIQPCSDNITKWITMLQKLQNCPSTLLQQKYHKIIHSQISHIIQSLLKGVPARTILTQAQIKNIQKYGWVKIENAQILKFFIYKGLKEIITKSGSGSEYTCNVVSDWRLVCESEVWERKGEVGGTGAVGHGGLIEERQEEEDQPEGQQSEQHQRQVHDTTEVEKVLVTKRIGFKFAQFNTLFSAQNIVQEIELKIKAVQQVSEEPLLDRNQIEYILEHFNIRMSLGDEKESIGKLFLTFK